MVHASFARFFYLIYFLWVFRFEFLLSFLLSVVDKWSFSLNLSVLVIDVQGRDAENHHDQ